MNPVFQTNPIATVHGINDAYTQDELLRQIKDPVLDPRIPIEQAIDNLPLEGGVVRLGSYTYFSRGTITVDRNNVSIIGNSRTLISNTLTTGTILHVTGSDFGLSDVRLYDNSTSYAITVTGDRARITNVIFEDVGGMLQTDGSDHLVFKCCRSDTVDPATYLVELKASNYATVMGNIINGGSTGIYADDSSTRSIYVGNNCPNGISYKGASNTNAGNIGTVTVR